MVCGTIRRPTQPNWARQGCCNGNGQLKMENSVSTQDHWTNITEARMMANNNDDDYDEPKPMSFL